MKQDILDFQGNKVTHSRKTCNGVRLHYYTAGQGPALILLHGVPKTSYYWRKLIPIPVSYTHLDVYKRQVYDNILK